MRPIVLDDLIEPERPLEPIDIASIGDVPKVSTQRPSAKLLAKIRSRHDSVDAGFFETNTNSSTLKAESALVELARTALVHGKVEEALGVLSQHEAKFPDGQLAEERESLAIQCLVNSHKGTEARVRADDFRRRFPRSIMLPAVEAVIESISATEFEVHPR